jgi:hypothetical protein
MEKVFTDMQYKVSEYDLEKINRNVRAMDVGFPCHECGQCLRSTDAADGRLCIHRWFCPVRGGIQRGWRRQYVHLDCIAEVQKTDTIDQTHVRGQKATYILLLMLELDLPFDIAWPIAALACWLL